MPEMLFHIRWPDGATEQCYSPSLVIKDHLAVGTSYDVAEFMPLVENIPRIKGIRGRSATPTEVGSLPTTATTSAHTAGVVPPIASLAAASADYLAASQAPWRA